ncbi:MAG TPA: hypothetical protein VGH74_15245 [Planctomycetaceae bacterium]|jgi:DNA-directed RNA polymerase specialized sigma24 family protein
MAFPQTRLTLIQRLADHASQADWREFMQDYWGPVCRFAQGRGNLTHEDAEDIATEVFEAISQNRLLERWSKLRSAKLRTLICCVARNVLSNRTRVEAGRARLVREHGGMLDRYAALGDVDSVEAPRDQLDAFYAAWVDDTLRTAVEGLLSEYDRAGKGDYFSVFYGRLCEQLPMAEIADLLQIKLTAADSYYRHVRDRLGDRLKDHVREQVLRYSAAQEAGEEFASEWAQMGEYLRSRGGLEAAVRKAYEDRQAPFGPPPAQPPE